MLVDFEVAQYEGFLPAAKPPGLCFDNVIIGGIIWLAIVLAILLAFAVV